MKLNVKGGTGVIVKSGNRDIYNTFLKEIERFKPLSREEEYETFVEYRERGNFLAKEKIHKHNLLFVVSVARKYSALFGSNTLHLEDLINEGSIGLINAVDKFNYNSGFKFISYAVWHIKKQILISINNNNKNIRIPRSMRNELNQFLKEQKVLEQELGRDVSVVEVFDSLFYKNKLKEEDTLEKFERLIVVDNYELSLNTSTTDDDKVELIELLESEDFNPTNDIDNADMVKSLQQCLEDVPRIYRKYIIGYYGLFGNERMTYNELSEKYDIPISTVRTKVTSCIRNLTRRKKQLESVFN